MAGIQKFEESLTVHILRSLFQKLLNEFGIFIFQGGLKSRTVLIIGDKQISSCIEYLRCNV